MSGHAHDTRAQSFCSVGDDVGGLARGDHGYPLVLWRDSQRRRGERPRPSGVVLVASNRDDVQVGLEALGHGSRCWHRLKGELRPIEGNEHVLHLHSGLRRGRFFRHGTSIAHWHRTCVPEQRVLARGDR